MKYRRPGLPVVGVDGSRGGWVAVVWSPVSPGRVLTVANLSELGVRVPAAEGFAVDIPIGLPTRGPRLADVVARDFVGPRRNSVFPTPIRAALERPTHAEASEVSRRLTGSGLSRQSYALIPKILEAEGWIGQAPAPVWEVHPEVSFAVLLGHPAQASKKTREGRLERRAGLEAAGLEVTGVEHASGAAVDDVLDAAVAAWSAHRLVNGLGLSLPDRPERDPATGRPVAIWA